MIGRMPLSHIIKNGVDLNRKEMSKEELSEVRLRAEWGKSALRKALIACTGISLDELPEQYAQYKEQIATLREYGLGLKEEPVFNQIIEWLETHDGNMPKGTFRNNNRVLKTKELTEEQLASIKLYKMWIKSPERKALIACTGIPLDKLPEQYTQYKEQIATLREYGLGLKEESVFDQIIDWLETHDGNMPRSIISKGGKQAKRVEMTEAEIYEVNLYYNWLRSGEREAVEECRRNTNR